MSTVLEIEQMSLEEKLRTMEALWDDLCQQEEAVPVPQWHKDILDERERLIKSGDAKFIDWETAKQQIDKLTRED
jgi:Putative addiction module component